MLLRLILLFTLVPLLELYLLLAIAVRTSPQFTFALVIATGVLGAVLARRQGFRWRQKMATQLQQGEVPTDGLLDGLMIFIAGALLLTPGVLTDLLGFALLITPLRSLIKGRIRQKIAQSLGVGAENSIDGRPVKMRKIQIETWSSKVMSLKIRERKEKQMGETIVSFAGLFKKSPILLRC